MNEFVCISCGEIIKENESEYEGQCPNGANHQVYSIVAVCDIINEFNMLKKAQAFYSDMYHE